MVGRGAGAQPGDWHLRVVESADIVDDRLSFNGQRIVGVRQGPRTEAHLLRPFDILVTARSHTVKVALVPPDVSRTIAAITLLVVRTPDPGTGLAHYLWFYLTSTAGRAAIVAKLSGTTLPSLSAKALGEVRIPLPPAAQLRRWPDLIEAAETARSEAMEVLRLRHDHLRASIIADILEVHTGKET